MKRYYEQFFPDAPLQEITESAARARSYYIREQQAPTRYEHFSNGTLDEVIYPDCPDPMTALEDLRARYDGLAARIYAPRAIEGNNRAYKLWYVDNGCITRALRYVYQDGTRDHRVYRYDPQGALVGYKSFIHKDWGLAEIKTYDAVGNLVGHEDVDP